jgi:hypothetical protein
MQDFVPAAKHPFARPEPDDRILLGNRRQIEMMPVALLEQVTGKIVFVQTLHNHDDRIALLVIEP